MTQTLTEIPTMEWAETVLNGAGWIKGEGAFRAYYHADGDYWGLKVCGTYDYPDTSEANVIEYENYERITDARGHRFDWTAPNGEVVTINIPQMVMLGDYIAVQHLELAMSAYDDQNEWSGRIEDDLDLEDLHHQNFLKDIHGEWWIVDLAGPCW